MKSWTLPEIGDEKVVYVAKQEGVAAAQLPSFVSEPTSEKTNEPHKGRLRVTESDLEELLSAARAEGFEQGRCEGEKKGYEDAAKKGAESASKALESAMGVISQIEASLPSTMNVHNQQERQLILQLIEKLLRSITQTELHIGQANMEAIIEQAVGCLADADQVIEVRVAQLDYDSLESYQSSQNWRLVADPTLKAGDCIIEARRALLDHTVEHRIDEAVAALKTQLEPARLG
ncbi:MAG: FliH/SctL family protein [Pseudomonadales bacterium]